MKVFNEEMESFVQNKMKDNNGQKCGELGNEENTIMGAWSRILKPYGHTLYLHQRPSPK